MSPTGELAVEHGQLTRILLAVDHLLRFDGNVSKANLGPISQACKMIRLSVVDHQMKIEEEHIYPQFDGTELADCAKILKAQHDDARKLLARMESLSRPGAGSSRAGKDDLKQAFNDFKDVITAHAAFEETVLFPVMEGTWSQKDLKKLRETQEEDEKKLMGDDAAEKTFEMLTSLEASCGITGLRDYNKPTDRARA